MLRSVGTAAILAVVWAWLLPAHANDVIVGCGTEFVDAYKARRDNTLRGQDLDAWLAQNTAFVEQNPKQAFLLVERAQTYQLMGKYDLAAADIGDALRLAPALPSAIAMRARSFLWRGKLIEAQQDVDTVLSKDPNNKLALKLKSDIAIARKDPKASFCHNSDPADDKLLSVMREGNKANAAHDYPTAVAKYKDAHKLAPKNTDIAQTLGLATHKAKDTRESIVVWTELIALQPNRPNYWSNRAAAKIENKDWTSALQDVEKAIALDPKYADAYVNKAVILKDIGKADQAIAAYNQVLQLTPNDGSSYARRAELYGLVGKTVEEIRDYRIALLRGPLPTVVVPLAFAAFRKDAEKSGPEGLAWLAVFLRMYPKSATAADEPSTLQDLVVKSGSSTAMFILAQGLANETTRRPDFAQALQLYEGAATGGSAEAMNALGVMHANGKGVPQDYSKARHWLRKSADAGNKLAMYNLAELLDSGFGGPKDHAAAVALMRCAASKADQ